MTPVNEKEVWAEKINQMDVGDRVLGGDDGPINQPIKNLTNRTAYLRALIAKVISEAGILNNNQDTGLLMQAISKLMLNCKVLNAIKSNTADEADKLKTQRLINGIAFDGTKDINVTPAGAVQYFAMTKAPTGWIKANGATLSRTLYANLFAAIGTTFGAGDGKTTFNIPDLRGEFLRAWDDDRGIDMSRGFGSFQGDTVRNVRGEIGWRKGTEDNFASGVFEFLGQDVLSIAGHSDAISAPVTRFVFDMARQVPTSHEVRVRNISLLACIKI